MHRINNPHDHRDDAPIRLVERLAGGVALSVNEDGIPHARLSVVQGDEIPLGWDAGQGQGLHYQQAAVLVVRVADGGNNCTGNFADEHQVYLS